MLTFKCLHAQGPKYLSELLQVRVINRTLRSSEATVLVVLRYNYVYSGNRAFSVCAPKLWNNLPVYVRKAESLTEFKKVLKSHLFLKAYKFRNCITLILVPLFIDFY